MPISLSTASHTCAEGTQDWRAIFLMRFVFVYSGDFPESMEHLIGMELLTALSSGLSYDGNTPNAEGDFLPSWLYFDK